MSRPPFALAAAASLVLLSPVAAQKVEDIVGVHRCKPGLVPPLVLDRIVDPDSSYYGRPLDGEKMAFHDSVPAEVSLKRERTDLLSITANPPIKRKQFIIPGLLELDLEYDKRSKRVHRWSIEDVQGKLLMYSHSGSLLRLRRGEVCFLDLNHDGAFGGPEDGYVIRERRSRQWIKPGLKLKVYKMTEPRKVSDGKVWFHVDSAGFRVAVTTKKPDFTVERRKDYQLGLDLLNRLRKQLGHEPVTLDPLLTEACEKHCLYCSLNGGTTHEQERGKPGYSRQGAKAGKASELTHGNTFQEGIDSFLSAFFHRIRMLSPCLEKVGMGNVGGYLALDTMTHYRRRSFEPYAWPCDGVKDVPVTWDNGENPSPLGGEQPFTTKEARKYGYPITLTFPSDNVKEVKVKLQTAEGRDLSLWVRTPENPAHRDFPNNFSSLFIMSQGPLSPRTTYKVTVDCAFKGKPFHKEWSFTTR